MPWRRLGDADWSAAPFADDQKEWLQRRTIELRSRFYGALALLLFVVVGSGYVFISGSRIESRDVARNAKAIHDGKCNDARLARAGIAGAVSQAQGLVRASILSRRQAGEKIDEAFRRAAAAYVESVRRDAEEAYRPIFADKPSDC